MKLYLPSALALSILVFSCNNGTPDNVKAADTANFHRTDSLLQKQSVTDSSAAVASKQDADFMVKALAGGMLEVQLGQLAQTNGSSQGVKDFGQMMVQDHGQGGQQIRALAAGKGIIFPDSISTDQKKERDDLQKKTGKDFDKAYIRLMISDHKEDIEEFKKAGQNANDPDIKTFAANTIPMLQKHLDAVENLKKSMH
jgi:putative membrane protein